MPTASDAPARGWTLAVSSAATALLLLDVTVVNVALPAIDRDLDASFAQLQWVIDAYALALAATLLTAGAIADRLGRRRVFLAGLMLFAAASLACGLAGDPVLLDVARALQGIGGAAAFATSLALLADRYLGGERGFAFTVWGAVSGAALALGPLVGGGLVDTVGWRWAFLINLPLCALIGVATIARVRESRDADAPLPDVPGAALFTTGSFLVVYGLIRGNEDGWGSGAIVAAFLFGGLALLAFAAVELRRAHPMLDLRLFRRGSFSGTALVAFSQSFALYPMFLFLAIYLQDVLGYSAWETGLRLLPVTLVLFAVAPLSGRLTARLPLRVPLCAGLVIIGIGLLLMRNVEPASDWTALLPGFVVGGAGIGVISPALAAAMVSVLSVERSGLASGVNNTFRQLGIAVGIAALGAIFEHTAREGGLSRAAVVGGLDDIFLVAALVALLSAPPAWLALGRLRAA